ncbi:DUF397 domain-containing protein [Thermobifida alba]|uniref:DUF397 domain-containing protein n=1 Tax=Thermobifida alba TaxID=53522 RepID=A0ABY4L4X8_THEAE|nr:DUF397 domain-containing protein [Thermobifida alba]UPT22702.1 DUF397 domain-containing protein [Thermobifida alba]
MVAAFCGGGSGGGELVDQQPAAAVRDSKHPEKGHLEFPASEWAGLLGAVRTGRL